MNAVLWGRTNSDPPPPKQTDNLFFSAVPFRLEETPDLPLRPLRTLLRLPRSGGGGGAGGRPFGAAGATAQATAFRSGFRWSAA